MTNPMPTPNIPDEVVRAAQAAEEKFWAEDSNYPEKESDYDNQAMLDKATRLMLEAALPLLLEQVGWLDAFGTAWNSEGYAKAIGDVAEPLYRLKVSNEHR